MRIAVIYKSKYGATKKYAQWIAEEVGPDAALLERKAVKPEQLAGYDLVIYGGGLYAGGISGVDLVAKHACKRLVLFTVGLTDPASKSYYEKLDQGLPAQMADRVFHLHGAIDYAALNFAHKTMMRMLYAALQRKPEAEQSADGKAILATYGKQIDHTKREAIAPLVAYARSLL